LRPLSLRQIYMFLINISSLELKYSFWNLRHMMSGLLKVQAIFVVLFAFSNSLLKQPVL